MNLWTACMWLGVVPCGPLFRQWQLLTFRYGFCSTVLLQELQDFFLIVYGCDDGISHL
jgi:hypothetical protein